MASNNMTWMAAAVAANHAYTVVLAWGVRKLEVLYVSTELGTSERMESLPTYSRLLIVMILLNPATLAESWRIIRQHLRDRDRRGD